MEEIKEEQLELKHYIGWSLLLIVLVPVMGLSLYLHMKENRESVTDVNRWQANWSQLKLGLSKEEVLALVGAPNSTTVFETKAITVATDPPDQKVEQDVQQTLDKIGNYAVWSYYGQIVIHTLPGEDNKAAESDGAIQLKELVNLDGESKLHGHAIKFNEAGEIVEISP